MSLQGRHGHSQALPIGRSVREYGRGVAGGLVFSLPLIFTMEMWTTGFVIQPDRTLLYMLSTFVLLLGYNRYAGLHEDASWTEVVIDSVEELGLGLVIAGCFMLIIGRIAIDMHISEIMGKIVMEGMTVAIGVSVGTAQLGGGRTEDEDEEGDDSRTNSIARGQLSSGSPADIHSADQLVIAFCAAVLFGATVAPTEEILVIGVEISSWNVIGLMLASILVGVTILYYSEFPGMRQLPEEGRYRAMATRGVATYTVALVASASILWFFGRFDGVSLITGLSQTVVLGTATTLGASAGRLLLQ